MSNEDKQEIDYKEESDGTVVISIEPDDDDDDHEEAEEVRASEGGEADSGDDDDGEISPIREARRARRKAKKEYVKKTNQEKDQRLQILDRQNRELTERLANLERKAHSADLAQLDRAIQEEQNSLFYAKARISEAGDSSNGTALAAAQNDWYEARQRIEALQTIKERAAQAPQVAPTAPNPRVVRLSNDWQDRNDWYDPDLRDPDSQVAKLVDTSMAKEGWDPSGEDYWEEFDRRLQKRLPHRYTDSNDERPQRRPRSVVVGGGRETITETGKVRVQIEPEKIKAIKEAGLWENPVTRKKMLERYAREQRKYNRG
jgi:hypothetical protein